MNKYLDLLYKALEAELGLLVETPEVLSLQQRLYSARRRAADPKLNCLSIAPYPAEPGTKLWIVKNVAKQQASAEKRNGSAV
jgi:hypothetical protein